jgi:hypothetical protein
MDGWMDGRVQSGRVWWCARARVRAGRGSERTWVRACDTRAAVHARAAERETTQRADVPHHPSSSSSSSSGSDGGSTRRGSTVCVGLVWDWGVSSCRTSERNEERVQWPVTMERRLHWVPRGGAAPSACVRAGGSERASERASEWGNRRPQQEPADYLHIGIDNGGTHQSPATPVGSQALHGQGGGRVFVCGGRE